MSAHPLGAQFARWQRLASGSGKKAPPGPEFDSHRAAIRARGHRVTPYRIGWEVGERNEDFPCPYAPGSAGERDYRDGVKRGRQRRAEAGAAAAKATWSPK